jgi:hypothetical protein
VREHRQARQLGDEVDRILAGVRSEATADPLLETARRLAYLVHRLPPVPQKLERRVSAIVHSPTRPGKREYAAESSWAARIRGKVHPALWGALTAALVFLVVWFVAPSGQQVWAQMVGAILGQTRVELTPAIESESRSVREPLRDLLSAELKMGRAPALPKTLPQGFELQEIAAVSYPDLPEWISQPLFLELCYGPSSAEPELYLREYRLLFKQVGGISGVQVAEDAVRTLEQVDVAGVVGTLLTMEGDRIRVKYGLLWERDGLLLELESDRLSKEELLRIARSVR